MPPSHRYCIVGAGPAGLSQARAFKLRGVDFDVYERHSDVGGLWDLENPGTALYESAHFISSRTQSGFLGFPMPESYPDYPSHAQVLQYLRSFADAYQLRPHIRFGTSVERVRLRGGTAHVTVAGVEHEYAGVVCASGVNWTPKLPEYPGEFSGVLRHSQTYRSPEEFRGKRVLIIGLGNSGADIACDAARSAAEAYVSVRRGYHFVPKHVFGVPADVFAHEGPRLPKWLELFLFSLLQRLIVGDTAKLGMPKPDHRVLESHPLMNDQLLHHLRHGDVKLKPDVLQLAGNTVRFKDGTSVEVDEILAATGYSMRIPYLNDADLERQGDHISHFLTVFSRQHPALFTLGFVELNGALYPHVDRLAALVAEYAHARTHAPERAAHFRELVETQKIDLSGGVEYISSSRHDFYCDDRALHDATVRTFHKAGWKLPVLGAWSPEGAVA